MKLGSRLDRYQHLVRCLRSIAFPEWISKLSMSFRLGLRLIEIWNEKYSELFTTLFLTNILPFQTSIVTLVCTLNEKGKIQREF